ncbi:DUF397 domain-containing protein [Pseudonocardia acaciae]|uniref:DUF397 domain-containing protein n=1 Tax=Pseudonocardia acaciae TaxID=551276 RepID=UPI00048AFFFE|nr:DUF397 domain-containing protein [Pseudonocardia acaciae]
MTQFGPHDFRSPSRSSSDPNRTCVDLACGSGIVELRDSKVEFGSAADHRLRFTDDEFHVFQQGLRQGRTDGLPLVITERGDGWYDFRRSTSEVDAPALRFNQAEVDAFYHDVHAGLYEERILAGRS